jgi:hypothetical protein
MRTLRTYNGLSQHDLVLLTDGITQSRVSRVENVREGGRFTEPQWLDFSRQLAMGDRRTSERKPVWLLACADDPADPSGFIVLTDEAGHLGYFSDHGMAWRACRALAELEIAPWPFALPAWMAFVEDTAANINDEPGCFYEVDANGGRSRGMEEITRRARAAVFVGSVMRGLVQQGAAAELVAA